MINPFVLNDDEYKRDINLTEHYLEQASFFLVKQTHCSKEEAVAFIKSALSPGGEFEFHDPRIRHTLRENYEDRSIVESGVLEYITDSLQREEVIAPTLTTYVNPKERESIYVSYTDENVASRAVAKKKMFSALMEVEKRIKKINQIKEKNQLEFLDQVEKNQLEFLDQVSKEKDQFEEEAIIQNTVQANSKISNNSLSGAHVSASTPVSNKTAHSSLTSTCRITSGYGNVNNEKFISGNRHYKDYETVINNITSICSRSNYVLIQEAIDTFHLKVPTIKETVDCIRYSTQLYFNGTVLHEKILNYVSKLTDIERVAFVYTGDLYHLKASNEALVRTFIDKLSKKCSFELEDPVAIYKSARDPIIHLAVQICGDEMRGVKLSDVFDTKKDEEGEILLGASGKPILGDSLKAKLLASTILNIQNTIKEYSLLIRAFWTTYHFPASVAYLPQSIRRVVLVSDTDSTIFTVQDWVQWFFGELRYDSGALAVCASIVFLATQTITHLLAMMSVNLGIEKKRIHQIQMKNEYRFDVFVPTPITKHYYALIGFREGNLYAKFKDEIKGVHLKSSNAPVSIIERAHEMMREDIMMKMIHNEKISLEAILKTVADIERSIISSIKSGKYEYLRLAQIKESESYQLEENKSPFQHYTLWNEVFGPKYGLIAPPPYTAVKVSTTLAKRGKLNAWVDEMQDKELSQRMRNWLEANDKKGGMGTFQIPDAILSSRGFPEEIFNALDIRRIIVDANGVFYHILETLGVYMLDKARNKIFSDYY